MLDVNEHFSFQLTQPERLDEDRGIKGMGMLERKELSQEDRQGEGWAEHSKGSQAGSCEGKVKVKLKSQQQMWGGKQGARQSSRAQ